VFRFCWWLRGAATTDAVPSYRSCCVAHDSVLKQTMQITARLFRAVEVVMNLLLMLLLRLQQSPLGQGGWEGGCLLHTLHLVL